jgi:hypothetical protein
MTLGLLFLTLLGFIPYLVLVWRAPELRWSRVRSTILTFALLLRIGTLTLPNSLSNDTARYLWDGKIQVAGYNPYVYAPNAPELVHLRDDNWRHIDHPDIPTVSQPIPLLIFRLVATIAPHRWMFRLLFMIADMLTFWFLVQLLRARKQNESLALIWALNPLVIMEFAGSGHFMSLAIALFIAGLWMLQVRLTPLAALAFGAATLTHPMAFPLAVMVLVAARIGSLRIWLWLMLPIALGYLLFLGAGTDLWSGAALMASRCRFNGSVYELAAKFLAPFERTDHGPEWMAHEYAGIVCLVLIAGAFVWLTRRRIGPVRAALSLAGCILLASPTVYPWYLTWLVALVCLEFSLPWLMFSAVVILSYITRIVQLKTTVPVDAALTRWVEYTPLYALLLVVLWRKRFDTAATAK